MKNHTPSPLVEVALNGSRTLNDHPGIPRTPNQIADAARKSVGAGAGAIHLHVFDAYGHETFEAERCAETLRAVRTACPRTPISLTTSAIVESDPDLRHELISRWTELPDLVSANVDEPGIETLVEHLAARGV